MAGANRALPALPHDNHQQRISGDTTSDTETASTYMYDDASSTNHYQEMLPSSQAQQRRTAETSLTSPSPLDIVGYIRGTAGYERITEYPPPYWHCQLTSHGVHEQTIPLTDVQHGLVSSY